MIGRDDEVACVQWWGEHVGRETVGGVELFSWGSEPVGLAGSTKAHELSSRRAMTFIGEKRIGEWTVSE